MDVLRTRAATCMLCAGDGAIICPASERAVELHVFGEPCPRGKHPDENGIVRRCKLPWKGLPWPQRIRFWLAFYQDVPLEKVKGWFGGCGCIIPLKRAWDWIALEVRALWWGSYLRLGLAHLCATQDGRADDKLACTI